MRELSEIQEMALLRDQIARICAAGCPETYRLPERGWRLVHEALILATAVQTAIDRSPARSSADRPSVRAAAGSRKPAHSGAMPECWAASA